MLRYTYIKAIGLLLLGIHKSFSMPLILESPAFKNNSFIPKLYTCEGKDSSPPLAWKNIPDNTRSFVLIVNDPDAPNGDWVHWLVFNLPATVNHLDAAARLPDEALSGKNSWDKFGYRGPCPPKGIHHYVFTLYALDTRLTVNSSVNKMDILNAMEGHIIASRKLIGLYRKL